jgi:hypothetical protein
LGDNRRSSNIHCAPLDAIIASTTVDSTRSVDVASSIDVLDQKAKEAAVANRSVVPRAFKARLSANVHRIRHLVVDADDRGRIWAATTLTPRSPNTDEAPLPDSAVAPFVIRTPDHRRLHAICV